MLTPDGNRMPRDIEESTHGTERASALGRAHTGWQLVRFLVVGGINTVFGYSVFYLLMRLGMSYPSAIGLATIAGVSFNFQSVGRLVFGGAPRSRFLRFVAVYCIVYALNVGGVHVFVGAGINVYLANALVLLPLSVVAFLLNRRYVF